MTLFFFFTRMIYIVGHGGNSMLYRRLWIKDIMYIKDILVLKKKKKKTLWTMCK